MGPGEWIADRYRLEARLSIGTRRAVWKAYDRQARRTVRLELIDGQAVDADVTLDRAVEQARRRAPNGKVETGADGSRLYLALTGSEEELGLTAAERRRFFAVVLRSGAGVDPDALTHRVLDEARALEGRPERLDESTVVVAFAGSGAMDQAYRAARLGHQLRIAFADAAIAVITDVASVGEGLAGRALISADRLFSLGTGVDAVAVDETTVGLLEGRFVVADEGNGLQIWDERAPLERQRELLRHATPFVGRGQELDALRQEFIEAIGEGQGPLGARVVLLVGEAGIGKSRLRQEFLKGLWAEGRQATVLLGTGSAAGQERTFGAIASMLISSCGIQPEDDGRVRAQKLGDRVSRAIPDARGEQVEMYLGDLVRAEFHAAKQAELQQAKQDPVSFNQKLRDAWVEFLRASLEPRPMVLVVEDLQWCDWPSIRFLGEALRALEDQPLVAVALGRPEALVNFPGLFADMSPTRIDVEPLDHEDAVTMVGDLAPQMDAERADYLARRSGGHPFFLEELVRVDCHDAVKATPHTVEAVIQARLSELSTPARNVLCIMSVLGRIASTAGIRALLGSQAHTASAGLDELVGAGLVTRDEEGDRIEIRQGLVRDAAYSLLPEKQRRLGHALAARYLSEQGTASPAAVALHYDRGGHTLSSCVWYRRAADEALSANDLEAVVRFADASGGAGLEGQEYGLLSLRKAEALYWMERLREGLSAAEVAVDHLEELSGPWFAALGEATACAAALLDIDKAERFAVQLDARLDDAVPTATTVLAAYRAAWALSLRSDGTTARGLITKADAYARHLDGDPLVAARAAWVHAEECRGSYARDDAAARFRFAIERLDEVADVRSATRARADLSTVYKELGAYAESEQAATEAMHVAAELGLGGVHALARTNCAIAAARQGRLDEGLSHAIALTRNDGAAALSPGVEGLARLYCAMIRIAMGDVGAARHDLNAAERRFGDEDAIVAVVYAVRALVELEEDRLPMAVEAAAHAWRAYQAKEAREGVGWVWLLYARTQLANGDQKAAARTLEKAQVWLEARAAAIEDERLRRRFTDGIWEHAAIAMLARQLLLEAPDTDRA